jgi:hypothetical protein
MATVDKDQLNGLAKWTDVHAGGSPGGFNGAIVFSSDAWPVFAFQDAIIRQTLDAFYGRALNGGRGVVGEGGGSGPGVVGIAGDVIPHPSRPFPEPIPDRAKLGQGTLDGVMGFAATGNGMSGSSGGGIGVAGTSTTHIGVDGRGGHIGLHGVGGMAGVLGMSSTGHGVVGIARTRGRFAGTFTGNVQITGDLTVFGSYPKSVAVRLGKNGPYRRFYSMESPESWFEDFGEASLRRGRAEVRIPRDFAPFIHTKDYHVFVTPYGECGGLSVTRRTRTAFEVRELNGGTSSVRFSYRIAAKRKDIVGKRLEAIQPPDLPEPMEVTPARGRAGRNRLVRNLRTVSPTKKRRRAG